MFVVCVLMFVIFWRVEIFIFVITSGVSLSSSMVFFNEFLLSVLFWFFFNIELVWVFLNCLVLLMILMISGLLIVLFVMTVYGFRRSSRFGSVFAGIIFASLVLSVGLDVFYISCLILIWLKLIWFVLNVMVYLFVVMWLLFLSFTSVRLWLKIS